LAHRPALAPRVPRALRLSVVLEDLLVLYGKEWVVPVLQEERDRWQGNYERLAGTFPIRQLLWLRRRLLGLRDPPPKPR
jgi:hypothetical protein